MARCRWQLPLRLTLGPYFLYSGFRKFEPEAPARMEPLVQQGYPLLVEAVGFERLFGMVRLLELLLAFGLLTGKGLRLAGAGSAVFGGLLLLLIWRLPDTVHGDSRWKLTTRGMEHLKNVWIVGIGLALALGKGPSSRRGCGGQTAQAA